MHDPWASPEECREEYGLDLVPTPAPASYDLVLLAVAHREFAAMEGQGIRQYLKPNGLLFDLKYVVQDGGADARL